MEASWTVILKQNSEIYPILYFMYHSTNPIASTCLFTEGYGVKFSILRKLIENKSYNSVFFKVILFKYVVKKINVMHPPKITITFDLRLL